MKRILSIILLMLFCFRGYAQTIDPVLLQEMGHWLPDGEEATPATPTRENSSRNLAANFDSPLNITVTADPEEGGTVTGTGTYDYNSTAVITATPNEGYVFSHWTINEGTYYNQNQTFSFTVTTDAQCVSHFQLVTNGIVVGEAETNSQFYPICTSYSSNKYSFSEQIYTAGEIGRACNICSVAFFQVGSYDITRNLTIFLVETDQSRFIRGNDLVYATEANKVFDGNVTMNYGNWTEITFDKPILYNGTSNLALIVVDKTGSDCYRPSKCRTFNTSSTQALYYWGNILIDPTSPTSAYFNMSYMKNQVIFGLLDATHIFVGGGNTEHWSETANWQLQELPSASSKVCILAPAELDIAAEVESVDIYGPNASLTLLEGSQLRHGNAGVQAVMQKTISPYNGDHDGYWFIASPMTEGLDPAHVTNMLTNNYDLYKFDQTTELEWRNYKSNSFTIDNTTGYLYANSSPTTLGFNGTLMPSDEDVTIPLVYSSGVEFEGWNLIGNPFPCNAYLVDDLDYYKIDAIDNVLVPANGIIAPGEGIFVRATSTADSVTFSRNAQANGYGILDLSLTQNRGGRLDMARIRFGEGKGLDKFAIQDNDAKLYINLKGHDYAVAYTKDCQEIPVNFKAAKNGQYTLSITPAGVEMTYLHLIDNFTGADVDLIATPSYTFTANTTDYESRFRLVFAANDGPSTGSGTFAFISNGDIIVNGEGTLQVIDMTGRVIRSSDAINRVSTSGMTPGVYVLRLINANDVKTQKIVVR